MAHYKNKDLNKRTQSDKILTGKDFVIASYPKYDGYQRRLDLMGLKFCGIKSMPNQQLADELHKAIMKRKSLIFV